MNFKLLFILSFLLISGCKSALFSSVDNKQTAANKNNTPTSSNQTQHLKESQILSDICENEISVNDPQAFTNIWHRVKQQLNFPIPTNKRLQSQKNWYAKHPTYMKRVTERARPYLFYIVQELEKNNMPLELAFLPIVESAFDPFAYSHGRASGMWQFIPSTGKNFGLKQNWWYDGRRDVYLSTQGAIKFLKYLHKRFKGDWLHALAAYNSGEGNVRRAIRKNKKKNKPTDFWSLDLPRETKAYVPKLLALSQLLIESDADQTQWTSIANLPYFDRVETESQIDLSLAAALADMSMTDFYQLNPAYNQWATAPKGPHYILLPLDKVEKFKTNLADIPSDQRISYKRYTIKNGDSLIKIAKQFGTTVAMLKDNNAITSNSIRAGKSLLIPVASKAREKYHKSNQQRLFAKQNTQRKGRKINLTVKQGDSMWAFARKYKVNVRSLAKWNNIAPTDPLKIGQKLVVWTKQPQKFASIANGNKKTKKIYYKVRQGDSFARIASKFNVSMSSMKRWNKKDSKKKYLQPGDSLMLYVDITRQY